MKLRSTAPMHHGVTWLYNDYNPINKVAFLKKSYINWCFLVSTRTEIYGVLLRGETYVQPQKVSSRVEFHLGYV